MRHSVAPTLFIFALTAASTLAQSDATAAIDGNVEATPGAQRFALPSGELLIDATGDAITVSVRTEPLFVASLCIGTPQRVTVLHASAALGDVVYSRGESGWVPSRKAFEWGLRDDDMAARAEYFRAHGWVASTMEMGRPGEVELLIGRELWPDGAALAIGLMPAKPPHEVTGWPERAKADCGDATLVSGEVPTGLTFEPERWQRLDPETKGRRAAEGVD